MSSLQKPFATVFPGWSFNPRCRVPLAKRMGAIAEYLLSQRTQIALGAREPSALQYVTLTSRAHWALLRESLVSLHRTWRAIPQLVVVSDGSWEGNEFIEAFRFWPNQIRMLMPKDVIEALKNTEQSALAELAQQHPLGLKLAVIVLLARERQTLFVDSDILWFSDPQETLATFLELPGPAASVEEGFSFNEEMLRRHCPERLSPPYVNSGCVLLKGDLCSPDLLQMLSTTALEQPKHNFNEQTIIALAVQRNGRRLPAKLCLVDFNDAFALRRRRPWREGYHARHYVNWMRHQFYRDALKLRRSARSSL